MSRFVRPDTTTLKISNGDTLIVKRRLNAHESRVMRAMKEMPTLAEPAVVMAYLVDWSLVGDDGQRVKIAGVSPTVLGSALDSLDEDAFDEIHAAVSAHVAAMLAEREIAKKKMTSGDASISPSLVDVDGVLAGSVS